VERSRALSISLQQIQRAVFIRQAQALPLTLDRDIGQCLGTTYNRHHPAPPQTRVFLQYLAPLLLLSLGLMQSGCAVMETYMVEMRDGTGWPPMYTCPQATMTPGQSC